MNFKKFTQAITIILFSCFSSYALSDCVQVGATTTCDTNTSNPYPSTVGAGNSASADSQTININSGSGISSGNASAISLRDGANITVNGIVQNNSTNSSGGYNTGGNTIEFRNNSTLTINSGGQVLSLGTQGSAEAVNPQGANNTILNYGTIHARNAAAIWQQSSGKLTVDNYGIISTGGYVSATGVPNSPSLTRNVIGGNTGAGIDFYNRESGIVYGSLTFGSGNDNLYIYTGSKITGTFNGGGGTNSIYFRGSGVGLESSDMTNFQYLYKDDPGTWTISGSIENLIAAQVRQGTLILTNEANSAYQGSASVYSGATLQGNSNSLPGTIANDGTVRFDQSHDAVYGGAISGLGNLEKTNAGLLDLTGTNTYSGGTKVLEGGLGISSASNIGSGTISLYDSTTLQANSSFSISNTFSLIGQSTINTQANDVIASGVFSGSGGFNKTGEGMLWLNDTTNTYTGPTIINEGILRMTGSITSNTTVAGSGTLQGGGTINGNLVNYGLVQPSYNGVISNITVNGNYVGQGGTFRTNVYAPDTSPTADLLVISGVGKSASGTTFVEVVDKNGLGEITKGDGIKVVSAINGATTAPGSFKLPGDGTITSSIFNYQLYRGPVTGSNNNWYLRTVAIPDAVADQFAGFYLRTSDPSNPVDYTADTPAPINQLTANAYERIEVVTYPSLPTLARFYNYGTVDTLDQRRGDLVAHNYSGIENKDRDWIRVLGRGGAVTPTEIDRGGRLNFQQFALQFGVDIYQNEDDRGGRTYLGPYMTIGTAKTDVRNWGGIYNVGSSSLQGITGGFAGTYFDPSGWYVDGLAQVTRYVSAKSNSPTGDSVKTTGWDLTASLEAGKKFNIGNNWNLTPQAQIVTQSIRMNDVLENAYSEVQYQKDEFSRGRLGILLNHQDPNSDSKINYWGRLSMWKVFKGGTYTTFATDSGDDPYTYLSETGSKWLALDLGVTSKISKTSSVYISIGGENSINDANYYTYYGRLTYQSMF